MLIVGYRHRVFPSTYFEAVPHGWQFVSTGILAFQFEILPLVELLIIPLNVSESQFIPEKTEKLPPSAFISVFLTLYHTNMILEKTSMEIWTVAI
jgi:hypothetical protein